MRTARRSSRFRYRRRRISTSLKALKWLGHPTVSVTSETYAHSLPGWRRQVAEVMERDLAQSNKAAS